MSTPRRGVVDVMTRVSALMKGTRKPEDIPDDEMRVYILLHNRWEHQSQARVLEEAATIFNLAVAMAGKVDK
jgi:hypothetical protein